MNNFKTCQICSKTASQLLVIRKGFFYSCDNHTKKVEKYFSETIDPLTKLFSLFY